MATKTAQPTVITFEQPGTFEAYYAAVKWCKENGYSTGSMQRDFPIGIHKGDWQIPKWLNMDSEDREGLDGYMESNDFRDGIVRIVLKNKDNK